VDHVLGEAGRAALKAFLSSLLVVAIGISQQTNLDNAVAIGIAGLMAAFGTLLAVVQTFVPELSLRAYLPGLPGVLSDAFIHAFLGAFIVALIGIFNEPNYSTWHAAIIAAVIGAINVGLRAVQGALTTGEDPSPRTGIRPRRAVTRTTARSTPSAVTILPA
jgi:uncharacterized membrane protein YhaH (DUF805 family)